ncbi:hypothetical protein JTE90_009174 [Oedothorax gibbosus]|uniref:Nose resistant-to-fluoxetine protein N-terminal domain-containing protein n=1 Tax=Oedothorax gibbosus TaxID=931172 RepID=A0AAV6UXC8_9ARAC|nr:hypothetical protein JTE90_009174 [Oedothorax gibbosus]
MLPKVLFLFTLAMIFSGAWCGLPTPTSDPVRPHMHLYEGMLRNLTSGVIRRAMPAMYQVMEKVNISTECSASLVKYAVGLRQIKVWAMRMFDASAKLPSGMFDGTVMEFGAFDQCLAIQVKNKKGLEDFRGQYCSVEAVPTLGPRPRNLSLARKSHVAFNDSIIKEINTTILAFYQLSLRFGICVPSDCTTDDIQVLAAEVLKPLHNTVRVSRCHIKEGIKVEPVHVVVLFLVFILLLLLCGGTALEYYINRRKVQEKKPMDLNGLHKCLLSFSVQRNVHQLCTPSSRAEEMKCLHGIRALSMTWVVLGHTYIWVNFQALTKATAGRAWFNNIEFEVILNGWLSVSSFIFLSGLLTSYTTLKYLNISGGRINIFLYIFRRFIRLYPSMLLLLGAMFFLPWVSSGPFWAEMPGVEVDNCRRSWWANLAFINNWRPINEMCMQHSWYVSADMQLHVVALLVLLPLYRNVYAGLSIAFSLALGGILAVGIITYINDYDPTILISTANLPQVYRIAEEIHVKTFTYLGPYCIGIGTGYLLLRCPKPKLRWGFRLVCWSAACVLGLMSLYGTHYWNTARFPSREITALYASLHRTTFVAALAWVAYACITGYAGTISSMLKSSPFVVMSRLTFMTYLAQGPVIWTRYGSLKERMFYSHYNMLYEYVGNLVLSLAVAFAGHILVEAPFANLERLFFSSLKTPKEEASKILRKVEVQREVNGNEKCQNNNHNTILEAA